MEDAQARLRLHLSKCHSVGNHMSCQKYKRRFVGNVVTDLNISPTFMDFFLDG